LSPQAQRAVRSGPHVRAIAGNGWRPIVRAHGKVPCVGGWQTFGAASPNDRRLRIWRATVVRLIERPGAAVFPVPDLDRDFGAPWSVFR
jgi:hypothetical protein